MWQDIIVLVNFCGYWLHNNILHFAKLKKNMYLRSARKILMTQAYLHAACVAGTYSDVNEENVT